MTEKDMMMEGWERLPPSFLDEAQARLDAAEDGLVNGDEGYHQWLAQIDAEQERREAEADAAELLAARRQQELEGEGFADREVGMG